MSGHRPWRELREQLLATPEAQSRYAQAGATLDQQIRDWDERAHQALAAVARVEALHFQYRGASDGTDFCAHCNQITGGWVPWPCPTIQTVRGGEPVLAGLTGDQLAALDSARQMAHAAAGHGSCWCCCTEQACQYGDELQAFMSGMNDLDKSLQARPGSDHPPRQGG